MIGSTVIESGTAPSVDASHRYALLTARTGLEPDLAQRYTTDPLSVLTEFGLTGAEPVYLVAAEDVYLENLDQPGTGVASFCNFTHGPSCFATSGAGRS
ncbi:hypothetical protein ACPB9J_31120 [Streptomyces lavendulocolor]|uniref:hypothetical protein n=1 Tax=Streptomyces lavendulocolor TaxID=67316 RepID=UPI003C2E55B0